MMTHEQEERDYLPQSEAEMCLQEAQLNRPQDAEPKGEGDFRVVVRDVHFCAATDAVAGAYIAEETRFLTKEQAEQFISDQAEAGHFNEEYQPELCCPHNPEEASLQLVPAADEFDSGPLF